MNKDYSRTLVFPLKISRKEEEQLKRASVQQEKTKAQLIREGFLDHSRNH